MASKHMKQDQGTSQRNSVTMAMFIALMFAAIAVVLAVHTVDGDANAVRDSAPAPSTQQPLSQEGRLVAVSPTSVTARSIDGFARTYLIDSQTNAITEDGSSVGGAGSTFAIDDEVAIVGVVRDGTAVATAVADSAVTNLNGPPMDAV